ncbi:MAG: hypothetical protein SGI94_06970 [Saprospiraceae bacterium]|nr:hypothetical protein [Saprospiraceae bacterium]
MNNIKLHDEVAEFPAQAAPEQIIAYRPSASTQARYDVLVCKKKEEKINPEEVSELEHYNMLEHIFRLAKIRASIEPGK